MQYFVLECFSPDGRERAELEPAPELGVESWVSGSRFPHTPETPIALYWEEESEGNERLALYDAGPVLIRKDLTSALQECGVQNLDVYDVVVRSRSGGAECTDYVAVNIIGLVACANMEKSNVSMSPDSDALIDVDFDGLVIDESRSYDLPLFRLAECVTCVLVSEEVKRYLESLGGFGLAFVPPAEWSG